MKCPHCLIEFHSQVVKNPSLDFDVEATMQSVSQIICPSCGRSILFFTRYMKPDNKQISVQIFPKNYRRPPPNPAVPEPYAKDYIEACNVFQESLKASAALSRYNLQNILRDKAGVKPDDLYNEIQEVLDSGKLPSHLSQNLDAVRAIGNFGSHPIKSKNTGSIVPVEEGEAEWLLDVIEGLFDFYFVLPETQKQKRDSINKKLKEAGKPPLRE